MKQDKLIQAGLEYIYNAPVTVTVISDPVIAKDHPMYEDGTTYHVVKFRCRRSGEIHWEPVDRTMWRPPSDDDEEGFYDLGRIGF